MHAGQCVRRIDIDDAITRDVGFRNALDGDDRPLELLVDVDHLPEGGRIGIDHVIAQHHGKRFVADQRLGDEHRMTEAERLALADIGDLNEVGDLADLSE
jgi:hypothetical protein